MNMSVDDHAVSWISKQAMGSYSKFEQFTRKNSTNKFDKLGPPPGEPAEPEYFRVSDDQGFR